MSPIEIRKEIIIDASPQVVFKAITDPNELINWFPDQAILEPKVGGKMKFNFHKRNSTEGHPREIEYVPQGTVKEFVYNKKVSYTWKLNDVPEFPETVVSWELEEIDSNKTRIVLTHSGFTGREEGKLSYKEHEQGWSYFLDKLAKYCKEKV